MDLGSFGPSTTAGLARTRRLHSILAGRGDGFGAYCAYCTVRMEIEIGIFEMRLKGVREGQLSLRI